MFKWSLLKPPHGWPAVAWDLAVVTVGVLIALVVQQWADEQSMERKTKQALNGIRAELANHYRSAIEWRVVEPCIVAQIDSLTARVLESGARLNPAPIESEGDNFRFVLRTPSKEYPKSSWEAATSAGFLARLEPSLRNELTAYYAQIDELNALGRTNYSDTTGINELGYALPLDASTRYELIHHLQDIRGQAEFRDTLSGQLFSHMQNVHMLPSIDDARALTLRFGTYRYCKAHHLPMRTLGQAMQPVPN